MSLVPNPDNIRLAMLENPQSKLAEQIGNDQAEEIDKTQDCGDRDYLRRADFALDVVWIDHAQVDKRQCCCCINTIKCWNCDPRSQIDALRLQNVDSDSRSEPQAPLRLKLPNGTEMLLPRDAEQVEIEISPAKSASTNSETLRSLQIPQGVHESTSPQVPLPGLKILLGGEQLLISSEVKHLDLATAVESSWKSIQIIVHGKGKRLTYTFWNPPTDSVLGGFLADTMYASAVEKVLIASGYSPNDAKMDATKASNYFASISAYDRWRDCIEFDLGNFRRETERPKLAHGAYLCLARYFGSDFASPLALQTLFDDMKFCLLTLRQSVHGGDFGVTVFDASGSFLFEGRAVTDSPAESAESILRQFSGLVAAKKVDN